MKLGFADTYDNAKKFFTTTLGHRCTIEHASPDILIFGDRNFGESNKRYVDCKKVFFTGENQRYWDYDCAFAITFDHIASPNHYRLPLYVLEMHAAAWDNGHPLDYLFRPINDPERFWYKRKQQEKTTTYIQSNPHCQFRTRFVEQFDQSKLVSAGPHLNNTGYIVPRNRDAKIALMDNHLFNIAFENGSHPGYVTEKLLDAMYAHTIPIYWGSKTVDRDFNPARFVNYQEFHRNQAHAEFLELIDHLTNDKDAYINMITQPVFKDNRPNEFMDINNFLNWWDTNVAS
jgi:alpha(1,3/1,4) fucosyltransferase